MKSKKKIMKTTLNRVTSPTRMTNRNAPVVTSIQYFFKYLYGSVGMATLRNVLVNRLASGWSVTKILEYKISIHQMWTCQHVHKVATHDKNSCYDTRLSLQIVVLKKQIRICVLKMQNVKPNSENPFSPAFHIMMNGKYYLN